MKYEVLEKDKTKYICLVLLNEIINFQHYFDVISQNEEVFIQPYLRIMVDRGVLEIENNQYIPTPLGREELVNLYNKYYDYLKIYDIYCAVDLEAGEFAFSSMGEDFSDDEWLEFLGDERFSDIRVAVAEFKKLDPIEIVFLSFLNEQRFDCTADRWEYNLTSDNIWREIAEICSTAVSSTYLNVDGVLEDVIKQGSVIALQMIKDAELAIADEQAFEEEEEVITTTTTVEYVDIVEEPYYGYDYYDPYYDPFYVSPLWLVPCILLF